MAIDYAKVQASAAELKRLLEQHASVEPEAALCQRELLPLIDETGNGVPVVAIRDPAGARQYFTPLQEFVDRFGGEAVLTDPKK